MITLWHGEGKGSKNPNFLWTFLMNGLRTIESNKSDAPLPKQFAVFFSLMIGSVPNNLQSDRIIVITSTKYSLDNHQHVPINGLVPIYFKSAKSSIPLNFHQPELKFQTKTKKIWKVDENKTARRYSTSHSLIFPFVHTLNIIDSKLR